MCDSNHSARFTANTGGVQISLANTSRTPTPAATVYSLISAASPGTNVESITITATAATTEGMIRLFLYDGTTYFLYQEISVPATTPTSLVAAFNVTLMVNIDLKSGWSIAVTTEIAETFNVTALGNDWAYCDCPV